MALHSFVCIECDIKNVQAAQIYPLYLCGSQRITEPS